MTDKLYQISAPHMTAGLGIQYDKVRWQAPIISYMAGWSYQKVSDYCKEKGWTLTQVPTAVARIVEEVRTEKDNTSTGYNRTYHRHNR